MDSLMDDLSVSPRKVKYLNSPSLDTRPQKIAPQRHILLQIYANLWLKTPRFGGQKIFWIFWHPKNQHLMAQQTANQSHIQNPKQDM